MSEDRVNPPYKTQASRVYAEGKGSYNLPSKIDAEKLCNLLNQYEHEIQLNNTIGKDLKTIIMDLKILKHDIKKVMEKLEQC